jgi:hypothetical protein
VGRDRGKDQLQTEGKTGRNGRALRTVMQGEYHSRVLPDVVHFMQLTDLGEESADGLLQAASACNFPSRHMAPSRIASLSSRLL